MQRLDSRAIYKVAPDEGDTEGAVVDEVTMTNASLIIMYEKGGDA